ncbi:Uncharacterised protein [Mycobacteroides abscessus subsp. abscessus]|nr:Uncharacterised protein [Mycobacteroides abscessus subsp. abscessus]
MTYTGYAPAPPQGQQQQPVPYPATGPGYPATQPPAPRGPRNIPGILGAIGGTIGLICGVIALSVTLTRPEPATPTPPPAADKPFMFSTDTDKQWCISMRPLLVESLEMTPGSVVENGPEGAEFQRYSGWVTGWAERMTAAMNAAAAQGSANGWLDRTGRRMVDLTTSILFIQRDSGWTGVARYEFNDAAATGTTVNAYCRSIGEPVRP